MRHERRKPKAPHPGDPARRSLLALGFVCEVTYTPRTAQPSHALECAARAVPTLLCERHSHLVPELLLFPGRNLTPPLRSSHQSAS